MAARPRLDSSLNSSSISFFLAASFSASIISFSHFASSALRAVPFVLPPWTGGLVPSTVLPPSTRSPPSLGAGGGAGGGPGDRCVPPRPPPPPQPWQPWL